MTLTNVLSVTIVVTLKSFDFKLSYLNSNFALTLVYLNPALNNPTLHGILKYNRIGAFMIDKKG